MFTLIGCTKLHSLRMQVCPEDVFLLPRHFDVYLFLCLPSDWWVNFSLNMLVVDFHMVWIYVLFKVCNMRDLAISCLLNNLSKKVAC